MGRIGKDNYEQYMIDYLDGQLPAEQEQELMRFLRDHPHLEEELRGLERAYLEPEPMNCPGKQQLKRTLTLDDQGYTHFDELCISRLEGNLTPEQARVFDRVVEASPASQHAWSLYRKTKLVPDASVTFREKSRLRKKSAVRTNRVRTLYPYLSAAASVILLVGLYLLLPSPQPGSLTGTAEGYTSPAPETFATDIGDGTETFTDPNTITSKIDYSKISSKLNVEVRQQLPPPPAATAEETQLKPLNPQYGINFNVQPVYASIRIPALPVDEFRDRGSTFDSYRKMERIINRRVSNTLASAEGQDFSLWDVAGAGLKGISKVTGKELALERHYNANGELQRLALKTESFRFSTRVNK